jgi:glycerol-3-phosphate acyltransferase PlsY
MRLLELGIKSLLAYLLGSLMGSLIVGRARGGVDIRSLGSGNAGGTNALRTQGKMFALWVMIIDVGKGVLATAWLPHAVLPGVGIDSSISREWLVIACAAAVILGHVYPLWYQFRGGKGAATLVGVLIGIEPVLLLPVLAVWVIVVLLTGYVGLATVCASLALPVYLLATYSPLPPALTAFSILVAMFVLYTHRSNITRMLQGTENRMRKPWLLRR